MVKPSNRQLFGAVLGITILLPAGLLVIDSFLNCETLNDYNPKGVTDADKFPDGTWTGYCHKIQTVVNLLLTPYRVGFSILF